MRMSGSIVGGLPRAASRRAIAALLGHTWTPREAAHLTRLIKEGTRPETPTKPHYEGIPIRVLGKVAGDQRASYSKPFFDPFEAVWTFWLGADALPTPREMASYDARENMTTVFVWDVD